MEQQKRGLCPYDDKRYLLADLTFGEPNPNTHAYGHYDLAEEEQLEADIPDEPGMELIIEHREQRFLKKNKRVAKLLARFDHKDLDEDELDQMPEYDSEGEMYAGELECAKNKLHRVLVLLSTLPERSSGFVLVSICSSLHLLHHGCLLLVCNLKPYHY